MGLCGLGQWEDAVDHDTECTIGKQGRGFIQLSAVGSDLSAGHSDAEALGFCIALKSERIDDEESAAPLPLGIHVIAPMLATFRKQHPRVFVDLRLSDRYADIVEQGIDIALRIGDLADSRLLSRKLAKQTLCCFASPAYLSEHGRPETPSNLANHDTVALRFQSSGQVLHWPFQTRGQTIQIMPTSAITVDASDALISALLSGAGIGMTSTLLAAPHVEQGTLIPVLEAYSAERRAITAVWPESRRNSPAVRAFLEVLTARFQSSGVG